MRCDIKRRSISKNCVQKNCGCASPREMGSSHEKKKQRACASRLIPCRARCLLSAASAASRRLTSSAGSVGSAPWRTAYTQRRAPHRRCRRSRSREWASRQVRPCFEYSDGRRRPLPKETTCRTAYTPLRLLSELFDVDRRARHVGVWSTVCVGVWDA